MVLVISVSQNTQSTLIFVLAVYLPSKIQSSMGAEIDRPGPKIGALCCILGHTAVHSYQSLYITSGDMSEKAHCTHPYIPLSTVL